jgi:hypothetical protein
MILPDLHDVQQLMLRTYVQSVMLFATLPFYLAQGGLATTEQSRRARHVRSDDIRWLR